MTSHLLDRSAVGDTRQTCHELNRLEFARPSRWMIRSARFGAENVERNTPRQQAIQSQPSEFVRNADERSEQVLCAE